MRASREIVKEIAAAIECAADEVEGEIALCGHSAGGHLVDADDLPGLAARRRDDRARIARMVSISGLHDLRPLMATKMNDALRARRAGSEAESPALLAPRPHQSVVCWVGADERPEFIRQSRILGDMWRGFDARDDGGRGAGPASFQRHRWPRRADHPLTLALAPL